MIFWAMGLAKLQIEWLDRMQQEYWSKNCNKNL